MHDLSAASGGGVNC